MNTDHSEQLTALKVETAIINAELKEVQKDVKELTDTVQNLTDALNKYKGASGIALLMLTLVLSGIGLVFQYLKLKS